MCVIILLGVLVMVKKRTHILLEPEHPKGFS
jgi:hypothetical protein